MKKIVRKDAPKRLLDNGKKKHWSDRHKILISVVTWAILIGAFVFLTLMGDSIK